jgi:hypothetical protein
MDRVMVYTGPLPQSTDILNTNKFGMQAMAWGMQAILGTNTYVDGLACTPASPTPNLTVTVGTGSIYSEDEVDATAYSDLGTDTSSLYKQGVNATPQVLTITPPSTSGYSQVFLVEAILSDVDTGATVLNYFNASNPNQPFSGPANAGTSQYTIRQCKCTIALKAGVAAPTGSQTTPSPDAGYVGLYAITVVNGQTQITSTNIVALTTAPFIATKLPMVPAGVQSGQWLYGVDGSIGGNIATTASTATSSAVLTFAGRVPGWMAAGLKVYDQSTPAAITGGQTVLSFTGTTVTLSGNVNATVNSGDTIVFSNDLFSATLFPIPSSLVAGMSVRLKLNSGNVGASTLNINQTGAVAIHRAGGAALSSGDLLAGMIAEFVYDGSFWQIQNYLGLTTGATTNNYNTTNLPYALDTSTSSNTITVSPTPALPSSISAGQPLLVKLANPITGATTIGIAGVSGSPFPVVGFTGQPLSYGSGRVGEMLWMLFDGSSWQIINPPLPLQGNLTIYVNSSIGSDTYDGSQPTVSGTKGPLQHIQTAINKAFNYPPSQFTITIQLADGTYAEAVSTPSVPGPPLVINGDAGSPSNVLVTGGHNAATFFVTGPNTVTIQNLKASTGTGLGPPCCFEASGSGANINTNNTVSGFCAGGVFTAGNAALVVVGNHTYAGNTSFALWAFNNGVVLYGGGGVFAITQTISTPITLTYFCFAESGGQFEGPNPFPATFVNPGNVTGSKFIAQLNGVVDTQGQGVNYFPGNSSGSTSTGGQYA